MDDWKGDNRVRREITEWTRGKGRCNVKLLCEGMTGNEYSCLTLSDLDG